jgi:FkbM family methyltransferase
MKSWRSHLFTPGATKGPNEDHHVSEFFAGEVGVFVEVGANEPIEGSQTYELERRGWTGILVEPLAECAARLRSMRSARVYQVAAGAPEDCGTRRWLLVAGGLSTLQPRTKLGVEASERRLVEVRTLDSMLRESGVDHIDFLSIDVEGAELDVLKGLSLDRYRPRLVLLEDDAHSRDKHRHMTSRGYRLVRRTNLNSWYVPEGTRYPLSLFGRWQLFRALYLGAPLRRWKFERRRQTGPRL